MKVQVRKGLDRSWFKEPYPVMSSVVIDMICAVFAGMTAVYFAYAIFQGGVGVQQGGGLLGAGLALMCFGLLVSTTDSVLALGALSDLGRSELQMFYAKVASYSLGLIFAMFGAIDSQLHVQAARARYSG